MTSAAMRRLGRAVSARRDELDMTQLEVHAADGPSNSTLTGIESGTAGTVSRATLRKLDVGLRWEPGSARRVWEGKGDPVPLPTKNDAAEIRAFIERSNLNPATKDELLGVLANEPPALGEVRGA